jgi:hypothetical protein
MRTFTCRSTFLVWYVVRLTDSSANAIVINFLDDAVICMCYKTLSCHAYTTIVLLPPTIYINGTIALTTCV